MKSLFIFSVIFLLASLNSQAAITHKTCKVVVNRTVWQDGFYPIFDAKIYDYIENALRHIGYEVIKDDKGGQGMGPQLEAGDLFLRLWTHTPNTKVHVSAIAEMMKIGEVNENMKKCERIAYSTKPCVLISKTESSNYTSKNYGKNLKEALENVIEQLPYCDKESN